MAAGGPGGWREVFGGIDGVVVLLFALLVGTAAGLGSYTFVYARGFSYLTDDPAACANCHVMRGHYAGWLQSSHHAVAVCNDCHTPAGFFAKYETKLTNGFHHSFAFTSGDYPDPIVIKRHNLEVTEGACRKCHAGMVQAIVGTVAGEAAPSCVRCHPDVGHAE